MTDVLHYAAFFRGLEMAKWLVKHRVDIAARDNEGSGTLHWAASWGNLEFVKWLVDHGADIGMTDKYGQTALD